MIILIVSNYCHGGGNRLEKYKLAKVHGTAVVRDSLLDNHLVRVWANARIENSRIESNVSVGNDSIIAKSKIQKDCDIGRRNIISHACIEKGVSTQSNTTIRFASVGKYTSVAWNVTIGAPNHEMHRLAMAQLNYIFPEEKQEHMDSYDRLECSIGNDVWIAAGAHVLRGVNISDGAVVAANAVVTKDVPPYAIVAGVPAKIVGFRFSAEIIDELMDIKWWEFSDEKLRTIRYLFEEDVDEKMILALRELKERK